MADRMVLDLADPEELSLVARDTPFPGGILHQWLPAVQRRDFRYRFFKRARQLQRAVPVRAWDTPATPLERGQVEETMGRMLPLSGYMHLLEEEKQMLDVAVGDSDFDLIQEAFGSDLLTLTRGIQQRIMLMQGEAIASGKVTIGTQSAPENGLQIGAVDFGMPAGHYFTSPQLWTDPNADILGMVDDWKAAYEVTTGGQVSPGVMIMDRTSLTLLLRNEQLRGLYGTLFGTPTTLSLSNLNDVLQERNLPRIITDATSVPDHTGTMRRQLPIDRVIMLPEVGRTVGETQWGLTEEAKELVNAQALSAENAPGLVAVPMKSENPVRTGLLVTGIAMPVVKEPDLIMSVKVK